ncbi:MAG: thioredoxin family protein [Mesorhizobium sp.]
MQREIGNSDSSISRRSGVSLTRRSLLLGSLAAPVGLLAGPARAASPDMVGNVAAYRKALTGAAARHRFALIDIRADWCAVCLRVEREILPHPTVRRYLEHIKLVKVDITAMDDGNRQLLTHLRASGPPTFFVVDAATGQEYQETRSLGSFTRRDLIRRLKPFTAL